MSTPEFGGSRTIKNKYSPFGSGINRSLLTPCRQVGLSRKRKTSHNKSVKCSESFTSNASDIECSINDTTPLTHNTVSSERTKNSNQFINCQTTPTPNQESLAEPSDIKLPKKDLLQTFTSEDLFETNDDSSNSIEKGKEYKDVIPETETAERKVNDGKQNIFNRRNSNKFKKKRLSSSFSYSALSDNNFDNDFLVSNSTNQGSIDMDFKCDNSITSNTSLQFLEGNSSQNDNLIPMNGIKKCKIQLQKLSDNEIKPNDSPVNSTTCSTSNTLKKKYSNSIDDADFFMSTPEKEKIKRKSLEKKIVVLEKQIKEKKSVLENLERASVYKSKHNVPELKRLTSLWLGGCIQALKDLLIHLQAHGPMDWTTLLSNMQIPKEIVAKLPVELGNDF